MAEAYAPLKLQIRSADDVAVLSALMQDALISRRDIHFDKDKKEMVMIADRYRWEAAPDEKERVLTGIRIGNVTAVQHRNMSGQHHETVFYNLLHIAYEESKTGQASLSLTFSAERMMRLEVSGLAMAVADIAPPRPAIASPDHEADKGQDG